MSTAAASALSIAGDHEFNAHLLQLVGEPFLFLRRSYGDELVIHFGERVVGPARPAQHGEFRYEHGTYSLHLRGSAWVLKSGTNPAVFSGGFQDSRQTSDQRGRAGHARHTDNGPRSLSLRSAARAGNWCPPRIRRWIDTRHRSHGR